MNLIEIGCGKGTFLELLINNGFFVTGFDPAYEGTSPFVIKKPFFSEININADAIILRHVLEHIPDPLHFLKFITESNKNEGLIYIEVPSLDWICANRAWFDIYYEHVNYFRIEDFSRFFGKIIDRGYLFGGQYLFVVADLASLRDVKSMNPITNRFTLPDKFFDGIIHAVSYMKAQRGRNIIWGAGSKGVIFAFHTHRLGHTPDYVVDINPVKQGKFLPATGLPIISPEIINNITEEDTIFILNLNYSDEIKKRVGKKVLYFCGE
jgi:SAM-dependent methyltransferase